MSISALNWAWSQECPNATAKLVLLALADKANDDGECWPGMDHIASMVGVSTRQVSSHLATLEDAGLIVRKRKRNSLGRLGKNTYHVNCTSGSTLPVDQGKSTSGSELPSGGDDHRKSASGNQRKPASSHKATTKEQPTKPLAPAKPSRPPDPVFEALVEVCGLDLAELTKSARGAVNRAAMELREIGASPDGIRARAKIHRQRWTNAELTPSSLAKNYAQLGTDPNRKVRNLPAPDACRRCRQSLTGHDDDLCRVLAGAG